MEADESSTSQGTVEFLHRTVKDFLYFETVWAEILSFTPDSFHPRIALCRSYLLQLKSMGRYLNIEHQSTPLPRSFSDILPLFISHACKLEEENGNRQFQL